jgi:replicative DNA helicase
MLYEPMLKQEEKDALAARQKDWSDTYKRVNCLIAKQRNGPTGDVELEFIKRTMRFESHRRPPKVTAPAKPTETQHREELIEIP